MLQLYDEEESEKKMYAHAQQMGSSSTKGGDFDTNENEEEQNDQHVDEFQAYDNNSQDYNGNERFNHPMMI